jgi:hypothetical protein
MRHAIFTILLASTVGVGTASAETRRGLVLGANELSKAARQTLGKQIDAARVAHPTAFTAVADLVHRAPAIHAARRGRFAPYSAMFRRLGPSAVMALAERIAFDDTRPDGLVAEASSALRAGLLEAVGDSLRPELEPVFLAVLAGSETDSLVLRAASEGLGKLGTDAAASRLLELAAATGPKQEAVLLGLGECRRLSVATFLAKALDRLPDDARAIVLIESLRDAANAWAWTTPAVRAHAGEEAAIRQTAAQALWRGFLGYQDQARETARKALVVVGHPDTLGWVQAARSTSSPQARKSLDALEASFKAIQR